MLPKPEISAGLMSLLARKQRLTDDFEALWIEVYNNCHSNLLCGIIYRHPNGDLERFTEYLRSTADRIN